MAPYFQSRSRVDSRSNRSVTPAIVLLTVESRRRHDQRLHLLAIALVVIAIARCSPVVSRSVNEELKTAIS